MKAKKGRGKEVEKGQFVLVSYGRKTVEIGQVCSLDATPYNTL
jgi:hypothetical protein